MRAGLDYHEFATIRVYKNFQECLTALDHARVFSLTTKGLRAFHQAQFKSNDAFLFGPESRGLPAEVLDQFDPCQRLRIPMLPNNRSLNLSNAAAVVVYEAWRQCGFDGA